MTKDINEIKEAFKDYYLELWNDNSLEPMPTKTTRAVLNSQTKKIVAHENLDLQIELTAAEIEEFVKELKLGKSLRPYGFTTEFYKHYWGII